MQVPHRCECFMPLLPWVSISGEVAKKDTKETGTVTLTGMGQVAGNFPDTKTGKIVDKNGTLAPEGRPEGLLFMIVTLVLSLLALLTFVVAITGLLGPDASWPLGTAAVLIGTATSIMLLGWQLSWIWKIIMVSEEIRKGVQPQQIGAATMTITTSTFPGLGIFIGLGLAVAAAYVFSNMVGKFTKHLWGRLAELGGLLLGGLMLALVVRAWEGKALFDAAKQFL